MGAAFFQSRADDSAGQHQQDQTVPVGVSNILMAYNARQRKNRERNQRRRGNRDGLGDPPDRTQRGHARANARRRFQTSQPKRDAQIS